MTDGRPAIPAEIKRQVRQECGFGCAICGMPFFDYDHIEEYAVVKAHTADNLVLLCPNHHRSKPKKLSKERIIEAKKNPFNRNKDFTSPYKLEPSKEVVTVLGTNVVSGWYPNGNGEHHAIWVNGKSYFTIHAENNWLSVSLRLTDTNGCVLLLVEKGEVKASTSLWDYEWVGSNIKVRAAPRNVLLDLTLADNTVEVIKGAFLDNGRDGFAVENGALLELCEGNCRGWNIGGQCRSNGFGGWGLLNSNKHPEITRPSGFGCFRG